MKSHVQCPGSGTIDKDQELRCLPVLMDGGEELKEVDDFVEYRLFTSRTSPAYAIYMTEVGPYTWKWAL